MYNVHIKKCLTGIYFKSNLDRGGFIENIHVDHVQCDTMRSAFIRFENNYHGSRGGHYPTRFDHFFIQNVTCNFSGEVGIYAVGVAGNPLKNISLKRVSILHTPKDQIVSNAENLTYSDVVINGTRIAKPTITEATKLHTD